MNISEVYVGPFIVGILAIVVLVLPVFPDLVCFYKATNFSTQGADLVQNVAFGGIAIGFAYLIGVILDRVIDTVLEPVERHNRLRLACARASFDDNAKAKDPFPEDELRAAVLLQMGDAANAWIEGLRTRIRLMRTAAFMIPAVALALTFVIAKGHDFAKPTCPPVAEPNIVWFYAALIIVAVLVVAHRWYFAHWDPMSRKHEVANLKQQAKTGELRKPKYRLIGSFAPPRTHDRSGLQVYAEIRDWVGKDNVKANGWKVLLDISCSTFALYLLLLTLCAWLVGWKWNVLGAVYWVLLAGLAMALLAMWAWWRTTRTFMDYLLILNRQQAQAAAPAKRPVITGKRADKRSSSSRSSR